MKTASVTDLRAHFSAYLDQVRVEGPLVVTRNGKPVAVLVAPVDDNDLEDLLIAYSPRFQAMLDQSAQSIKEGKGLTSEEFWKAAAERHKK